MVSALVRVPLLYWPLTSHPGGECCGHPDEVQHADLVRSFLSGSDPGTYPPGLAFVTSLLVRGPLGRAASALAPEGVRADSGDRLRAVWIGRVLSLLSSAAAVFLLFALLRSLGAGQWLAATAATALAVAPLYAVQSAYGLADVPHLALVLGAIAAFLGWHRRPRLGMEILFGLLLGGAFAFKLVGVVIGLPPLFSMLSNSRRRWRTALAAIASFTAGAWTFSGGFLRFASPEEIYRKVVVENATTARAEPGWNGVHHVLSLVPGLGALAAAVLAVAAVAAGWRRLRRTSRARVRPLDPLPAVAAGAMLYFAGICFSSNPFTRHMLPLYPILLVFGALAVRTLSMDLHRRCAALGFAAVAAYGTFATLPVLASYRDDPLDRAREWVRARTGRTPPAPPFRNFAPIWSRQEVARPGEGAEALAIVHSAWVGRLTGRWWLKPAPSDLADVYHFEGTAEDLRFWQDVMGGRSREARIVRSFGEDWPTPERVFLSALRRGYDQFVGAGRADVVVLNPRRRSS